MFTETFVGIIIPFIGTLIGSLSLVFAKSYKDDFTQRILSSFAAGVMLAASIWSLVLPSLEYDFNNKSINIIQTLSGLYFGVLIMILVDSFTDRIQGVKESGLISQLIAITLHNIPEGMAVGLVFSPLLSGDNVTELQGAFMLSLGIAIQNIPEGAIVSVPLASCGISRRKAFILSVLSGVVEPFGALAAIVLTKFTRPIFPLFLSFAAGTMIYVVFRHLMTSVYTQKKKRDTVISLIFISGFSLMMSLDVIFG